jgi:hypothetical protein
MKTYTFTTHAGHLVKAQGLTRDHARARYISANPETRLIPDDTRTAKERAWDAEITEDKRRGRDQDELLDYENLQL